MTATLSGRASSVAAAGRRDGESCGQAAGRRTIDVLGFPVSALSLDETVDCAWQLLGHGARAAYVACANPHSLVTAERDPEFARALSEADLLLADGAGILLAGRLAGTPFPERVAGMEFFTALSRRADRGDGLGYYFLGSSRLVLDRMRARLAVDYPRIRIAGMLSPPFKDAFDEADDRAMVEAVNAARPDVLWVGMTAPKQEMWIARNRHRLRVPLIGAIGAVFDFYAGTRRRAPAWVCNLGLEWLPRLIREPRRLWRRTFVSAPMFVGRIIAHRLAASSASR